MLRKFLTRAAVLAALPFLFSACGDDAAGPGDSTTGQPGTFRAVADAATGTFEVTSDLAPEGRPEGEGGFVLRGDNIRYDETEQALLVDFTVTNETGDDYPEPVVLTFLQLLPVEATVKNSDNAESGAGAQIVFEFDDGNDTWNAGEESLPRTVMFGVDEGVAVGFVARIDTGLEPGSGVIGGMLWHDRDSDGVIDDDEAGLGGFDVVLRRGGEEIRRVQSMSDGQYQFVGLPADVYEVAPAPVEGWEPTTAPSLTVVLPEDSNFLSANFGCRRGDDGGGGDGAIHVGDKVHAKGWFDDDPARLVARHIEVEHRDDDGGRHGGRGSLRGPATGVDLENDVLYLMGTPIAIRGGGDDGRDGDGDCPKPDLDEVEEGDRVRVDPWGRVTVEEEEILAASRIHCWRGHGDRAKGIVQELRFEGEVLRGIRVLDTWVEITEHTEIHDGDCDDDDDDDDGDDD